MADAPRHPLLNPVLRFTKDPKPEGISGGGKNAHGIKAERLGEQRRALATQFANLAAEAARRPRFDGRVVLYAAMFDDSLAPTWTPSDLFQATRDARLIAPWRVGYLVEIAADQLPAYARLVQRTSLATDEVDISRVESVRFFAEEDAAGSLDAAWEAAPESKDGRAFVVWLMPLRGREAAERLIETFTALRDGTIAPPPPLLESVMEELDADVPAGLRRNLRAAAGGGDRINMAVREYRLRRRSRTTVIVPTRDALQQGHMQRGFVVDRARRLQFDHHLALADGRDAAVMILAIAVEQHAGVALAQPQHAGQVVGHEFGQDDACTRLHRQRDVAAGQAHAVASSMAWRVTSASSCRCSSSTQYGGIQYSTSPSGRSSTPRASAAR